MNWVITIEGGGGDNEVIQAAQRFVKGLIKSGHAIESASYVRGAKFSLTPDPLKWDTRKDDPKKPIYET